MKTSHAPGLRPVDAAEQSNGVALPARTVKHVKMKLTEANVLELRAPPGAADHTVWDNRMPGFGIRFRNGGAGSFFIQYRVGTKQRRQSLGRVGKVTLDAARREAKSFFGQIARKIDPAIERAQAVARASAATIEPQIQPFLDHLRDKGRSRTHIGHVTATLRQHFKALHPLSPADINRAMIATELKKIRDAHGPSAADHSRAYLSVFFKWLMGEGRAEYNPVMGTNKIGSKARERKLSDAELIALWQALNADEAGDDGSVGGIKDFAQILKLLILTGARRSEIASLSYREINFAKKRIELPGSRTKNGRAHSIPLSSPALAILKSRQPRERSDFVFGRGKGGYSGFGKPKERLDKKLGFKGWRLHDFRRTVSTEMNQTLKVQPHVVEAVLNHVSTGARAGVAGVYNLAEYEDEKRAALEKWGRHINKLVGAVG